jgi:hypothetical protein
LTQVPNYQVFRPLPNELDIAFMKLKVAGEPHVLMFDGLLAAREGAPAIVKHDDQFYLADSQFDPEADIPKNLKRRDKLAPLIGVIKLCPVNDTCLIHKAIFKDYPRSRRKIDAQTLNKISSLKVRSKVPKVFFSDGPIPADVVASEAPAVKYPGPDVLFSQLLKDSSFKNQTPFSQASSVVGSTLVWNLRGRKIGKGEAIYFNLPQEYRAKKLVKVTLMQRQDAKDNSTPLRGRYDASPSYTAVEFYALNPDNQDNWRYWGGKTRHDNPKGSFFADLLSEEQMVSRSLTGWNSTRGHDSNAAFDQDTNFAALRLIGVGADPATLYSLEVEFE